MNFAEAMESLRAEFSERATSAFRELLERKHLYQSVYVPFNLSLIYDCASKAPNERRATAVAEGEALLDAPWTLLGTESVDYSGRGLPPGAKIVERLRLQIPDVKLYCNSPKCRRVEPFNGVDCIDVFGRARSLAKSVRQMFLLQYVCQSCKGEAEVFLVRREALKLTLAGRSPIEHIDVPSVLPQTVEGFYSRAVVAHQSRETLAGNFLLRTLVEQWVRSFPPAANMWAETALDWYYSNLPDAMRQQFPSLREVYEHLSADIHAATGDETVFATEAARIVKHFDAWRLFDLDRATFGQAPERATGENLGPAAVEREPG